MTGWTRLLRQFDDLVHALYAVIDRDLKDRMLFLDPQPGFFRGFVGRIRGFRLPIHLEAKSATVRLLALRDRLRDGFLRRGWHGYGLGPLSGRRCHLMISSARCNIEMLLQATDDVTQRALTRFRRGCARVAAGHLPGGANAIVVKSNDRDVHGAAAVRCRAQLSQNQGLELRLCPRRLVGLRLQRLVGHRPLFKIAMRQRSSAGTFFCACCTSVPRTRCATPRPRSAAKERVWIKLRTWAAPGGARARAFSAWGSSLRAAPVSSQPCARAG